MKSLYVTFTENQNNDLKKIFEKCSFVGVPDPGKILIQFDVNLLLIDLEEISRDLFYQIILKDYGNFESFEFENPVSIRKILSHTESQTEKTDEFMSNLMNMKEMLKDYFSLDIGKGYKQTIKPF